MTSWNPSIYGWFMSAVKRGDLEKARKILIEFGNQMTLGERTGAASILEQAFSSAAEAHSLSSPSPRSPRGESRKVKE
jgi:hypothetical protein